MKHTSAWRDAYKSRLWLFFLSRKRITAFLREDSSAESTGHASLVSCPSNIILIRSALPLPREYIWHPYLYPSQHPSSPGRPWIVATGIIIAEVSWQIKGSLQICSMHLPWIKLSPFACPSPVNLILGDN